MTFTGLRVQPTPAGNHEHRGAVFAATPLAVTSRSLKLDPICQFSPVGWVQGAKFGVNRHDTTITKDAQPEWQKKTGYPALKAKQLGRAR